MNKFIFVFFLFSAIQALSANFYVWTNSPADGPGTNWNTAFHTIQDAIDMSSDNDIIWVTNGVYNTGSSLPPGLNAGQTRIVIDKTVTVQSVSGPSNTIIYGHGPCDDTAVRCVWIIEGATLSGFNIGFGYTPSEGNSSVSSGGGVYGKSTSSTVFPEIVNCVMSDCEAYMLGGGAYGCRLTDCVIKNNKSQTSGGGSSDCVLINCNISSNSADHGGGAIYSLLYNSCICHNIAKYNGGGAASSTLNDCNVFENIASFTANNGGGGASYSTLNNCCIRHNVSGYYGGGATYSILNNCLVYENTASSIYGGAVYGDYSTRASVNNCTIYSNSSGTTYCEAFNSIIYGNGTNNLTSSELNYCYTNDPHFVDAVKSNFQLEATSLCVNAGANPLAPTNEYDLAGNPRIVDGTVDIGAFEYQGVQPTTTHGTPIWWLEQYGITNDYEIADVQDLDADGLVTYLEFTYSTIPTNANTDGDQFNDGIEALSGANPLHDDSQTYGAILSNSTQYNLYTTNDVGDLSFGLEMLPTCSNSINLVLTPKVSKSLSSTNWTPMQSINWVCPATNMSFFRFHGFLSQ